MAIADDFSVAVNGDIRHVSGSTHYTVLELHRWLQDLADDQAASTSGNDLVDIASDTPSERITDQIINLLGNYNIDDTAAEYLYGGSITQKSGAEVYSGLRVLGAVNNSNTQLTVIQDGAFYDSATAPFWGTQSAGGYNGNPAAGILMRILIKSRIAGFDLNGQRVTVQARHWGDSYDFFDVQLGVGEAVAAISTTPDAQNNTAQGTVTAYTHVKNSGTVPIDGQDETSYDNSPTTEGTFSGGSGHNISDVITLEDGTKITVDNVSTGTVTEFTVDNSESSGANDGDTLNQVATTGSGTGFSLSPEGDNVALDPDVPVGGYQQIDINDGNGNQPYYSKWTYSVDTSGDGLKGVYEFLKDIMRTGSTKYVDGLAGSQFQGLDYDITYDNLTGTFKQREAIVWGTKIWYDGLAGGNFARGNYVVFSGGNAGKLLYDDGTDDLIVALEDISVTIADNETITEYSAAGTATGVTASVDTGAGGGSPIENNDKEGGAGWNLASDGVDQIWLQLRHGSAPVDDLPLRGIRSGATAIVNTTITSRTIQKACFLGSYTGSLIGAYGIGVLADDLSYPDTVEDLDGDTNNAPNNVTFTVEGLYSGEDYVLVGTKDLTPANDFDKDQLTLSGNLNGPGVTSVVCTGAIPADTPTSGTLRIQLDIGTYRRVSYTSWSGSTFTIPSTDFSDPDDASDGNNIFISYIDKLADAGSAAFTTQYSSPRTLWVRVRDGGTAGDTIPIKTFESQATLGAGGGSVSALRIDDA